MITSIGYFDVLEFQDGYKILIHSGQWYYIMINFTQVIDTPVIFHSRQSFKKIWKANV